MESLRSGLKGTRSNEQEAVDEQELNLALVGQNRRPNINQAGGSSDQSLVRRND
jgi:hypothetical protein